MVCVFCMLPSVVKEHRCSSSFVRHRSWTRKVFVEIDFSLKPRFYYLGMCGCIMRILMTTWDLCQVQKVISSLWNKLWADALHNHFFNASEQTIAQSLHLHSGERLNWLWWNFAYLGKRHICQVLIKKICWDCLFSFRDEGSMAQVSSEHTIRSTHSADTFFILSLKSRLLRPPSKVAS